MKNYYLYIDTFINKSNPGYGFANTKGVVAFRSKRERDEVFEERSHFDFSCKIILLKDAMRFLTTYYFNGDKGFYYHRKQDTDPLDFLTVRESKY